MATAPSKGTHVPVVKIKLIAAELSRLCGKREGEVELPEGATVQSVIDKLPAVFGSAVGERATFKDGRLQPQFMVYLNGGMISRHKYRETPLPGGQVQVEFMRMVGSW